MFNQKSKKIVKKTISAAIAAALVTNTGAALMAINSQPTSADLKYSNDSNSQSVTRIMMDGNNMLKNGFYMHYDVTWSAAGDPSVSLKFKIPGYDPNNLKFFIFNKNQNMVANMRECTLQSGISDPTPSIYLTDLEKTSYEVHVYNGSLNENNFVCKSDFVIITPSFPAWSTANSVNLEDAAGRPISNNASVQQASYFKPAALTTQQFAITIPVNIDTNRPLIPYWASTVKVAFFATNRENNALPNTDKCLYEYVYRTYPSPGKEVLVFVPDAQYGVGTAGSPVMYEAHFYADEVKEGNFICKATGISSI